MKHIFISLFFVSLFSFCSMPSTRKTHKVHFDNADIVFIDPCYFVKDNDIWENYCFDFEKNKSLDKLGCEQGICLGVGDVYPDVLADENTGVVIGELGSDSYLLGCFKLSDILMHNPDFAQYMVEYPNNFVLIKDFTGDVCFRTKKARYFDEVLPMTTIIGVGSTNFHSAFIDDDGILHFKPDLFHD